MPTQQVEQAMRHYFSQLAEATPANLYQMVEANRVFPSTSFPIYRKCF